MHGHADESIQENSTELSKEQVKRHSWSKTAKQHEQQNETEMMGW